MTLIIAAKYTERNSLPAIAFVSDTHVELQGKAREPFRKVQPLQRKRFTYNIAMGISGQYIGIRDVHQKVANYIKQCSQDINSIHQIMRWIDYATLTKFQTNMKEQQLIQTQILGIQTGDSANIFLINKDSETPILNVDLAGIGSLYFPEIKLFMERYHDSRMKFSDVTDLLRAAYAFSKGISRGLKQVPVTKKGERLELTVSEASAKTKTHINGFELSILTSNGFYNLETTIQNETYNNKY